MNNDLYLLGDVARMLGVRPYRIVYLLQTGQVPEPVLRLGSRRIFTIADCHRIAAKLNATMADEINKQTERRRTCKATNTKA